MDRARHVLDDAQHALVDDPEIRLDLPDNVAAVAPNVRENETRASLARLLFRGAAADQLAGTLSGGERLRATLATMLLGEPTPQLLLFDEPTNNLDLATVEQLSSALRTYRGALLIVSHHEAFLRDLGLTRWLELGPDGLHEIDPL
ncbi:MAG: ABC-F family ATP-binding cassette domain-containing protein [Microthrixaceae bacterium]|nr:ABC-F family ATP-binding cassette domain-containing protein [Mycobacterium sp.]MCB9403834.1 ABC-F family ATP-binding cassette domain-containing protein [Microthrixaceae bacterium]